MKIFIGLLVIVITSMGIMIVNNSNGENANDSIIMKGNTNILENEIDNKVKKIAKKDNNMNNLDDERLREHCKVMPQMKGCEKFTNNDNNIESSSNLVVLNNNQQLGEIPMDEGKIDIVFEIQNTGTEDIILGEANGSCFCTQGYITNEDGSNKSAEFNTIGAKYPTDINRVIKAGEKQIVTAVYDPEAHGPNAVGPTTRGLTIKTNSSSTPNIRLDFFGTVVKTRTK